MPTMQNLKDFVMKHEKQFINMSLHLHMEQKKKFFILEIGLKSPEWQYVVVMMDYDQSY